MGPAEFLADRQRSREGAVGVVVPAHVPEQEAQVEEAGRDQRVLRAEHFLEDREQAPVVSLGVGEPVLPPVEDRQVVQRLGHADVVRAEHLLPEVEGAEVESFRLRSLPMLMRRLARFWSEDARSSSSAFGEASTMVSARR